MRAIAVSANEWLYTDRFEYDGATREIDLHAPRGAIASMQLLIEGTAPGDRIRVDVSGSLPEPERYQMLDVLVDRNTDWEGGGAPQGKDTSAWTTRLAPFRLYDALQPFDQGGDIAEKERTALYIALPIPRDMAPGVYEGAIHVRIGGQAAEFPAKLTVHKAVLPEKSWLGITNWYTEGNLSKPYGIEPYSEQWFDMYGKLMKVMQRTRQTHIIIGLRSIGIEELPGGDYRFDFSKIERIIRMAVDAGFQTLELGHIGVRNYVTHENIWLFYRPQGRKIYAQSFEAYRFLAKFLTKWTEFLRENGWYDMCVQHVSDEPTMKTADDYRMLSGILRKFMPGVPLFDAIVHPELRGASDYWIPYNSIYQQQQEQWDELRELGDQIWCYTCTNPGGKWLNRTLDMELLRPRLMHWGNYRYDLKGYLHWGFNFWREGRMEYLRENSACVSGDGVHYWPPGDTHICYPGNENGPWMSARAERMRHGAEDCELLQMLAGRDKATADAICGVALRSFDEYTTDVRVFDANYIALLEALDQAL